MNIFHNIICTFQENCYYSTIFYYYKIFNKDFFPKCISRYETTIIGNNGIIHNILSWDNIIHGKREHDLIIYTIL